MIPFFQVKNPTQKFNFKYFQVLDVIGLNNFIFKKSQFLLSWSYCEVSNFSWKKKRVFDWYLFPRHFFPPFRLSCPIGFTHTHRLRTIIDRDNNNERFAKTHEMWWWEFLNFHLGVACLKAMWNTMECKRDSFNGSLGGASETHWECVSHCLKCVTTGGL